MKMKFILLFSFLMSFSLFAQENELLFSPKGIAEIHITLADGKKRDDIQNEKNYRNEPEKYLGKLKGEMVIKNSATSTYGQEDLFKGKILITGRGNTSWHRSQRPYSIDLVLDDWITERAAGMLGMPASDEWALLNNWVDRSVMRHNLGFYLGRQMNGIPWSPRSRYVEVWINDEYRGLYILVEKVMRGTNRVNVRSNNESSNNLSGGYILEATPRGGDKSVPIETRTQIQTDPYNINFVFEYPSPKNLENPYGNSQRMWIKEWLDEFGNALRGDNYRDPAEGYQKYIDENSFIDYSLLKELAKGCDDLFHASVFVQKDRNGKLNMTAPWDFDLSFGNSGVYNEEGNWLKTHGWFGRLNQDDRYAQKYIDRHEALLPLFKKIPEILRANYQQLEESGALVRNYAKFPAIIDDFESDGERRRTPTTYKGHVQWLSEWIMSRHNWIYIHLGRNDAQKGERMKKISPVIRIMDPEAVSALRAFDVKVMRSVDNDGGNKYTYSWNDGNFDNRNTRRISEKGKYWVKIKDEWGNISLASDTLYFGVAKPVPIAVTEVSLNKNETSLTVGKTEQLTATVSPNNATNKNVAWKSSRPEIAEVSQTGLITAKSSGTATITVTTEDGNKTAECEVTVNPIIIPVADVSLNRATNYALQVDESEQLIVTVHPENASNKNVFWESDAPEVVEVSQTGLVTAKSLGTANISVTTEDGEFMASCFYQIVLVGISGITSYSIQLYLKDSNLFVNTPTEETIRIYSVTGSLIYSQSKQAGEEIFSIAHLPSQVLIVKSSSGWVRKLVK
jgi:hypothetical protein